MWNYLTNKVVLAVNLADIPTKHLSMCLTLVELKTQAKLSTCFSAFLNGTHISIQRSTFLQDSQFPTVQENQISMERVYRGCSIRCCQIYFVARFLS